VDLGPAAYGAGQADEAGEGRAGLDRDEDPGEGPQPPLRDGQRLGGGRAALLERRAGSGVSAVCGLPAAEVCAAEQGVAGNGPGDRLGATIGDGWVGDQQRADRAGEGSEGASPSA